MVVTPVPTLLIYPTQELALPGFFRICPEWTQEVRVGHLDMSYQQKKPLKRCCTSVNSYAFNSDLVLF